MNECSEMARNVAVTSLIVALCLVAAVAGHSRYGIGTLGGVHGGVFGGVHSGVLGGVHSGVHGDNAKECSQYSFHFKFKMARCIAVISLFVALCLIVTVAGHKSYSFGEYKPVGGVHGGVHEGVHGGVHRHTGAHGVVNRRFNGLVHGCAHGGVHGGVLGDVHGGLGLVGSGIHGAGSVSAAHYPGLVPGYSFYDHQPVLGYNQCKFWCKSHYTNKYYCCQRPYQG
ncbi:uncharacterized protein LOC122250716 [Penaeus japonicus]|uniref:uncharacterized protein LOC122250716 n=1 Tax=Penaeus japonicus TaxID=27405 RepID=UPI001C715D96|nr:uncharacterized protein LOC122250716 [Penaeus japonicus]